MGAVVPWRDEHGRALHDVYDRPANLFVARFIGSPAMALFKGRVARADGGATVDFGGGALPLDPHLPVEDGRAVVAGVRPEHFTLSTNPDALPFRVALIEATGAEMHVHGKVADTLATVALPGRHGIRVGDAVALRVDPERVHLFDAATGGRIEAAGPT